MRKGLLKSLFRILCIFSLRLLVKEKLVFAFLAFRLWIELHSKKSASWSSNDFKCLHKNFKLLSDDPHLENIGLFGAKLGLVSSVAIALLLQRNKNIYMNERFTLSRWASQFCRILCENLPCYDNWFNWFFNHRSFIEADFCCLFCNAWQMSILLTKMECLKLCFGRVTEQWTLSFSMRRFLYNRMNLILLDYNRQTFH